MNSRQLLKIIIVAISLTILNRIIELKGWPSGSEVGWLILSYTLVTAIFWYYIKNATISRFKLIITVFIMYFAIGTFNLLIEAYIFDVTNRLESLHQILRGLILSLIASPLLVLTFKKWSEDTSSILPIKRSFVQWSWRILAGIFIYIFFYLLAGMILHTTYPPLMEFYENKIPPFDIMIGTQFPRGIVFALVAYLILSTMKKPLLIKAIYIGLFFSIIGAIAPLIPISEHMPQNIRLVHGIEVGISNTIYGAVLGFLLAPLTTVVKNKGPVK